MEAAYSVGVSNRFASLMAEDDDPGDEVISPTALPEKVEKTTKKKDAKGSTGGKQQKEGNREKAGQPPRKPAQQDSTKQGDKPQSAGRGRGGRQDNRRNQGQSGEDREFFSRGEGRGRGGRGSRPRLSSRDKENDSGFGTGGGDDRGFGSGSGRGGGFGGGERGFSSGGDRGFSGGDWEDRGEGGRGRGVGRFRGRGRGGGFRGKREFERRSGSDKSSVKPMEKRDGGGAHNWGKREDIDDWPEDGEESQPAPTATEPAGGGDQNGDISTAEKTEDQPGDQTELESPAKEAEGEEEEQAKEMTLDEYKAMMSKSAKEVIRQDRDERKPGENVDTSQWKNTIIYERSEGEYFPGTREVIEKPKTSGRIKTTLDANFFFKDPARRGGRGRERGSGGGRGRGRGGEGGRGHGGEGGRGRGGEGGWGRGGEGGRGRDEGRRIRGSGGRRGDYGRAPNVEDTLDFPNLPGTITALEQ